MPTALQPAVSEATDKVISSHSGDLPLSRKWKGELPHTFLDTFTPLEVTSSLFYFSIFEPWVKHIKVTCPAKSLCWVKMPAEKRKRKASGFLSLTVSPEMFPVA